MLIESATPCTPMAGAQTLADYLLGIAADIPDAGPEYQQQRPSPVERAERIAGIKSRIRKGYYNTDAVLEDLSNSFAGVFDKLT